MAIPRILIVEDEKIVAEALAGTLEDLGYEIAGIASTKEEAVRKAKDIGPDLILTDFRLPGEMDGIEAAAFASDIGPAMRDLGSRGGISFRLKVRRKSSRNLFA